MARVRACVCVCVCVRRCRWAVCGAEKKSPWVSVRSCDGRVGSVCARGGLAHKAGEGCFENRSPTATIIVLLYCVRMTCFDARVCKRGGGGGCFMCFAIF